ncbi:hypothetical protein AVEN_157420-1 [Araneus ventricosus]|uniref:CCHC-type domain-containing protein n=2 Tax=Araneus ventricosus TaxID=182803 RepID=A0A4Y2A4U2_ARAVE|nr:hypothetical protein AVEN_157420-1 [Araneus ventricosus]
MEFKLQKLLLENERCRSESDCVVTAEFSAKPKIDLLTILQKFYPRSNDINFYLILFERQAKGAEIRKKYWVSYLIGLLPNEMSQIIAREDEEVTEDYEKIKALLLKRYKLTPERFRQLFVNHNKAPENTWTDFVYESKLKKKVSAEIYDHFLDEWSQLKIPEEFANKLDDFENVRADRKMETSWRNQPGERFTYDCKEQRNTADCKFCSSPVKEEKYRAPRREQYSTRINMRKDCYVCGLSHLARDCPERSSTEDGGKTKIELLRPRLVIQRTNGELSVSRNGGFGELKKEIERLREDLERLRRQIKPSENEAVSTDKGSEDIESEQPEHCITGNPLKATVYGLADSENKDGHSNTYISDDELSNDEIIGKLTPAWMQSSSTSLLGLTMEGSRNISGSNCMTVSKV